MEKKIVDPPVVLPLKMLPYILPIRVGPSVSASLTRGLHLGNLENVVCIFPFTISSIVGGQTMIIMNNVASRGEWPSARAVAVVAVSQLVREVALGLREEDRFEPQLRGIATDEYCRSP